MWKPDGLLAAAQAFLDSIQPGESNANAYVAILREDFFDEEALDWSTYSNLNNTVGCGFAQSIFSSSPAIDDDKAVLTGTACEVAAESFSQEIFGWAIVNTPGSKILTAKRFATPIELPAGVGFTLEPKLTFGPDV